MLRYVSGLLIFAAVAGSASAQDDDRNQLERLKKQFLTEKSRLLSLTQRRFDELITELSNATELKDAERLGRVAKWREERDRFLKDEQVPIDADLAVAGFEYGVKLAKAYGPLEKKFSDMMKVALLKKDDQTIEQVRSEKRLFEDLHLPGRREFLERSTWSGTVFSEKKAVEFRIRITDVTGDAFNAVAERAPAVAGHPVHELLGSLDGIHLDGRYTKALRGKNLAMTVEGIVLGRSMVVYLNYTGPKGKPIRDIAVLRKG